MRLNDIIRAGDEPLPRKMASKWKWLGGYYALVRWVEANLWVGNKEVSQDNPIPIDSLPQSSEWKEVQCTFAPPYPTFDVTGWRFVWVMGIDFTENGVKVETSYGEKWCPFGTVYLDTSGPDYWHCEGLDQIRFVESDAKIALKFVR